MGSVGTQYLDLCFAWDVLESKFSPRVVTRQPSAPMCEKACPFLESRFHDSIVDVVVKSSEQILVVNFVLNWNSCQKFFCGGGNLEEKIFRNSVRFVVCLRDATSAMTLNNPDMWSTDKRPE